VINQYAAYPLQFGTTGAVRMTILSTGNVGIGTTTPATALHVIGTVTASAFSGGTYAGTIGASNVSAGQFGSGTGGGIYTFSGNVGIATTTPGQKLDVNGNITISNPANYFMFSGGNGTASWSAPIIFRTGTSIGISDYSGVQLGGYDGSSYGPRLTVLGSGNVGIGTTSPADKLYVSYAGTNYEMAATFRNKATTGNVYNGLKFVQGSTESFHLLTTNAATYLRGISNIPMIFYTNNAEQVRISETGNVGIGTTAPGAKLDVDGIMSQNDTYKDSQKISLSG